jgi:dTDP-4-dehydrorhamnose 3,5-epimerase
MKIEKTFIEGLVILQPSIFEDERGHFFESFQIEKFQKDVAEVNFVQDNQSFSKKGVVRGLHLQNPPFAQGKLVRVISGKAWDVAVDLRKNSPTYGQHFRYLLEASKNNMMYIPEGFAHGFSAIEDTIFFYKCTNFYNKQSETGIIWNDQSLGIDWGVENPIISPKDEELPEFKNFDSKF